MLTRNDMNPVSWTWKRGFYMSKLSYEDKINDKLKRKIDMIGRFTNTTYHRWKYFLT